ncbi:MAG: bifunctional diaminohydroxyphosphoribosylaminopyrimidine deaminase/5-amino-6-(5-phosphoribosylamino)uracil reductase RibD [Desulfovibrionaceae bacterium]|nr:bifunctional diaminohydroxyphosphoribosylaminopyrimidine deaminase/5-amino-6-(5-phosphoribosylamino)uracil reductase RibD [Desulfovibrionaceae bacterium]
MAQAINIASQAINTYPNPRVGALLTLNDKIVASGYHHGPGQPHAEIECLNSAKSLGIDLEKSTLVVTLEPCRHFGKTPPCTEAILKAGIKNLVVGCLDPNPIAQGGAEYLRAKGLNVITGVLEEKCRQLIADFNLWQTEKRPFITLKLAATIDGRIATRSGQSQWISSKESRLDVHNLRAMIGQKHGAILIGGQTFRLDNPKLTARTDHVIAQPKAIVITSTLPNATDPCHLISARPKETIFLTSPANLDTLKAKELIDLGLRLYAIPKKANVTDFRELFRILLTELETPHILCEGGGRLALSLLEQGVVDEFILYLAPLIFGDNLAHPLFDGRSPLSIDQGIGLNISSTTMLGRDLKITLNPK